MLFVFCSPSAIEMLTFGPLGEGAHHIFMPADFPFPHRAVWMDVKEKVCFVHAAAATNHIYPPFIGQKFTIPYNRATNRPLAIPYISYQKEHVL
jgi:hypothetical protein